jgi:hypothetical protein
MMHGAYSVKRNIKWLF